MIPETPTSVAVSPGRDGRRLAYGIGVGIAVALIAGGCDALLTIVLGRHFAGSPLVIGPAVGYAIGRTSGGGGRIGGALAIGLSYLAVLIGYGPTIAPGLIETLDLSIEAGLFLLILPVVKMPGGGGGSNLVGLAMLAFGLIQAWRLGRGQTRRVRVRSDDHEPSEGV